MEIEHTPLHFFEIANLRTKQNNLCEPTLQF